MPLYLTYILTLSFCVNITVHIKLKAIAAKYCFYCDPLLVIDQQHQSQATSLWCDALELVPDVISLVKQKHTPAKGAPKNDGMPSHKMTIPNEVVSRSSPNSSTRIMGLREIKAAKSK